MTTNAIPMSACALPKNWANASSPPAEEPMPTMGKGRYADCEDIGRFEAVLTDRCFARFDLARFFIVGILSRCPLPASVRSQGKECRSPAEEPMPTMGKGRYADCEDIGRFEAVLTDR